MNSPSASLTLKGLDSPFRARTLASVSGMLVSARKMLVSELVRTNKIFGHGRASKAVGALKRLF